MSDGLSQEELKTLADLKKKDREEIMIGAWWMEIALHCQTERLEINSGAAVIMAETLAEATILITHLNELLQLSQE